MALDSRPVTLDLHTIRLRGPWQIEPLARYVARADGSYDRTTADLPAACQATMPADWSATLGHDFVGVVRYGRNFQRPTGLGPGERVWLVVEPPRSTATVRLAGRDLGTVSHGDPPARFNITPLLADHNALEIVVRHSKFDEDHPTGRKALDAPGGLVGEVRLEIELG
jgi:hypothetical protein